ncbi:helix-turn-helix transcriptional regulator [Agromyces sp. NPDC056523]|uniref:helix-turn-helix transcriptional regulator n=1 Tax=Agromyces sp. NPDC056523 TaxID=3345850 RepID=UPI003672B700
MGEPAAPPSPPLVFDTRGTAPRDRIALTREIARGLPTPVDLVAPEPDRFRLRVATHRLGTISLLRNQGVGASVSRNERMSRRAPHARLIVGIAERGGAPDGAAGRPTELMLYSSRRSYVARLDGVRRTFVSVDYDDLRLPARIVEARLHRPIDARSGIPNVVATSLLAIADLRFGERAVDASPLTRPVIELVRTLLTVTAGDEFRAREPMRATLGERILRFMEDGLADPSLNVGVVARAHHISDRYVYAILQSMGIVFGDWVRGRRLEECAAMLSDPSSRALTVSDIAFRWGFRDHSAFSRAFHRSYGVTPSEWRRRWS